MLKKIYTLPWFSSEEWLSVYEDAFKNKNINRAYDQMCVWKSRCGKLPVAIEATFPLLRGLLAQQDAHLHESFKHSLITSSISRFVSIIQQSYMDSPDMESKILYGMDNSINMPPFLNKIRNIFVHEDEIMGAKETLDSSLEAALEWIKVYYWVDEAVKFQQTCANQKNERNNQKKNHSREVEGVTEAAKQTEPPPLEVSEWEDRAIAYQTQILKYKFKKKKESRKVNGRFIRTIQYMSKAYPDYCARTFFQIFFCSPEMNCAQTPGIRRCRMCEHTYTLNRMFLKYTTYAMKFLDMNIFIKEVVKNGQSQPKICFDWFQILLNTVESNKRCKKHVFNLKATSLQKKINWKATIFQLLTLGVEWSLIIGLRIVSFKWVHLDPNVKLMIIQLVKTYHHDSEDQTIFETEGASPLPPCQSGGTLQDLVKAAVINSPHISRDKLTSACQKVNADVEVKDQFGHDYCLGVLPHQVGDPYFFKKLIIDPEDSVMVS